MVLAIVLYPVEFMIGIAAWQSDVVPRTFRPVEFWTAKVSRLTRDAPDRKLKAAECYESLPKGAAALAAIGAQLPVLRGCGRHRTGARRSGRIRNEGRVEDGARRSKPKRRNR